MAALAGATGVTGVVMTPLVEEYGWSRSVISANVFICSILNLLLAPIAGKTVGKLGPRRVALAGVMLAIPSLLLIALSGPQPWTWYGAWIIFGAIQVALGPLVWSSAVSGLFDRSRGLALAVTLSGSGLAYFFLTPLAVLALTEFGWQGVYFMLMALFGLLLLPALFFGFRGREDIAALAPQRDSQGTVAAPAAVPGYTLSEALKTRRFWQFVLICSLTALAQGALMIHLYPILAEGGLNAAEAAALASLMGIGLIGGRVLAGAMLDRLPGQFILAAAVGLILLSSVAGLFYTGSYVLGLAISIMLGAGTGGTTNCMAFLSGRYFGLKEYASIFGILMGLYGICFGVSPMLAGAMRDALGSYEKVFPLFIALTAVSCVLAMLLGRPPRSGEELTVPQPGQ